MKNPIDNISLEQQSKYRINGLTYISNNESIVKKLHPEELYVVSKREGKTLVFNVKERFPKYDYSKMDLNTMWLSNFFGEGLPW
jgi:hypothetical protein